MFLKQWLNLYVRCARSSKVGTLLAIRYRLIYVFINDLEELTHGKN